MNNRYEQADVVFYWWTMGPEGELLQHPTEADARAHSPTVLRMTIETAERVEAALKEEISRRAEACLDDGGG